MAESKYIQSVKQAAMDRPRSTDWYKNKGGSTCLGNNFFAIKQA